MLILIKFRKIVKAICFVIMLLQIIYQSIDYFSYPINIRVDVNYDKQQTFPSISQLYKKKIITDNNTDQRLLFGYVLET